MSRAEFEILKKTIRNSEQTMAGRNGDACFALEKPGYVGLKLTNRCNLRCRHCYQWNEHGYHNRLEAAAQKEDMDIELIQKVLKETDDAESRLYIWGGEPLIYAQFEKLVELLKEHPREIALCTNAIQIARNIDALCEISERLELLIGLEGFMREHNKIRGKTVFEQVIANIKELVRLRECGRFKGKISIHTVINDEMVDKLYDYLTYMEEIGVDMVMLCFPWYISEDCQGEMDRFYAQHFNSGFDGTEEIPSWHSFDFKVADEKIPRLIRELRDISDHRWKMIVRIQPDLELEEVEDFIRGRVQEQKGRKVCLALSNRMDINPDGSVVACKFFPEFVMGNLKDMSIADIWKNDAYQHMRECVNHHLMPICTKCSELHLHGM